MPTHAIDPAHELRTAIESLSPKTRRAMLEALRCPATRIIAGGYVGDGGGVCPLLAAHRRGGRAHDEASASSPFAAAWDRFTRTRTGEVRAIEDGERRTLEAMLVESLAGYMTADAARSPEPCRLSGRDWLGPFRRYDDYRAALVEAGEGPLRESASSVRPVLAATAPGERRAAAAGRR